MEILAVCDFLWRKDIPNANFARFGLPHVGLQVFPVLSILFLFTSATGAGLWAVEDQKRLFYGTAHSGPGAYTQQPEESERKRSWWWKK